MNRFRIACLTLLFSFVLVAGAWADELDDMMDAYLGAILGANTSAFLGFLSTDHNWRFTSYRAGSSKIINTTNFSYAETKTQFDRKGGLYFAFFEGTPEYRYRDRIAAHPLSTWERSDNMYRIPSADGISFIQWGKEDGRWIIKSIGDDAP